MDQTRPQISQADRSSQLQQHRAWIRRNASFGLPEFTNRPEREPPQKQPTEQEDEEPSESSQIRSYAQEARQRRLQFEQEQEQQAQQTKEANEKNKMEKRKKRAAFMNGSFMISDIFYTSLDTASMGTSFFFTLPFRISSLLWKNAQMIWGSHFAKGKDTFIPPLSYEPISIPVDKDAWFYKSCIVAADIALGVGLVILGMGGICIAYDVVELTSSATTAAAAGASIAQGGTGNLCTGGIISSILGL